MEIGLIEINASGVEYYIGIPCTTQVTRFSGTHVRATMSHQLGY